MVMLKDKHTFSVSGLKTILEIEKIPYCLEHEISDQEPAGSFTRIYINHHQEEYDNRSGAIFIGELNRNLAYNLFGVSGFDIIERPYCQIRINRDFLPDKLASIFFKYSETGTIKFPCLKVCSLSPIQDFSKLEVFASFSDFKKPAIIKKGDLIWCLFDIGEAFDNLVNERYLFDKYCKIQKHRKIWSFFIYMQSFFYLLPAYMRKIFQRLFFSYWFKKIETEKRVVFRTDFPIDITGWALIQILRSMILRLNGKIVSIAKTPGRYKACFVLTHDIEPTKFSYTKGLPALLAYLEKSKLSFSIDLVAFWANKYCKNLKERLARYDVNCHGLYHNSQTMVLSYHELKSRITDAKNILENLLNLQICGYRSPRLNRSPDLLRAIEASGYKYSSISTDADRENTHLFGGGVSINYPYRPTINKDGKLWAVNFFEFPVTAPDCIMPLFMGYTQDEMFQMYRKKIDYIYDIEGMFVCINHAAVFNNKEIEIRMQLLNFLSSLLKEREDIWQVNMNEIYKWWDKRDKVRIFYRDNEVILKNDNSDSLSGLTLNIETPDARRQLYVKAMDPGETVTIKI